MLFTWPSRGDVLGYVYDKESATYSRDDLEYLLTRAALDPNVSDITVMAHSMGNWVMMEALRQMSIRQGHVFPKIKNVIMASPDLDVDVFRSSVAPDCRTAPAYYDFTVAGRPGPCPVPPTGREYRPRRLCRSRQGALQIQAD